MLIPSIFMFPLSTLYSLAIKFNIVLLPLPFFPIIAIVSLELTVKEHFFNTYGFLYPYLKSTKLNSIFPLHLFLYLFPYTSFVYMFPSIKLNMRLQETFKL